MIKLKLLKHRGSSMTRFTLLMFFMFGNLANAMLAESLERHNPYDESEGDETDLDTTAEQAIDKTIDRMVKETVTCPNPLHYTIGCCGGYAAHHTDRREDEDLDVCGGGGRPNKPTRLVYAWCCVGTGIGAGVGACCGGPAACPTAAGGACVGGTIGCASGCVVGCVGLCHRNKEKATCECPQPNGCKKDSKTDSKNGGCCNNQRRQEEDSQYFRGRQSKPVRGEPELRYIQ